MSSESIDRGIFYAEVSEALADPYPIYERFRKVATLHRVTRADRFGEPEWLVLGYEAAVVVLTSRAFGRRAGVALSEDPAKLPVIPHDYPSLSKLVDSWMIFMDPPQHTTLRGIVSDCLAKIVRAGLTQRIVDSVTELIGAVSRKGQIEFVSECAAVGPMLAVMELLGVPMSDRLWLRERIVALQDGSSFRPGPPGPRLTRADRAAHQLSEYFQAEIDTHRGRRNYRHREDDMLSLLLGTQLSGEQVVGTAVHLLASGHETTRNTLSKQVLLLLAHPKLATRLQAEPQLIPAAAEEFLRYDPPAQMVTRWAYRDCQLEDRVIQRGDKVTVVLGAANRDEARFQAASTLRLDRPSGSHCAFGLGVHYCLGSALGRAVSEAALAALVHHVPKFRLAEPRLDFGTELIFHGPVRLPLIRR